MNSGRTPACDVIPFDGRDTTSVLNCLSQDNNKQKKSPNQLKKYNWGNKCGHDKNYFKKPKFSRNYKRRPHVLEEAKRRIASSLYDYFRYPAFSGLFYHQDENKQSNGRKIRSERIEGTYSLALPMLLQTLNLHRMACGYYDNKNQFHYYNYAYIENTTEQSNIRVKREMKLLQEREIIKVICIREKNNDGSWRTKEVRIEFTDKIFSMLELLPEFLKDRETSSIKFYEKQRKLENTQKKREFYRKSAFNNHKVKKTGKISNTSTEIMQDNIKSIIKRMPRIKTGNGIEIRNKINSLISEGMSVKEALSIVKQQYPPKN